MKSDRIVCLLSVALFTSMAYAQNPELQQKIAEVKEAAGANKQRSEERRVGKEC